MSSEELNDAFIYFELPDSAKRAFTADNRAEYGDNEPPHVSVVYLPGLSDQDLFTATRAVQLLEKSLYPIDIQFGNLSSFLSEDHVLSWHVEVKSERLFRFREIVCELMSRLTVPVNDPYTNYIPHATLAYGLEGEEYSGGVPSGSLHLNKLRISSKKRTSN